MKPFSKELFERFNCKDKNMNFVLKSVDSFFLMDNRDAAICLFGYLEVNENEAVWWSFWADDRNINALSFVIAAKNIAKTIGAVYSQFYGWVNSKNQLEQKFNNLMGFKKTNEFFRQQNDIYIKYIYGSNSGNSSI